MGGGTVTKHERRIQILKEYYEREDRIRAEFWESHGGRPKGKGDVPRYIFADAVAELKHKWKEIEDEYSSDSD